MLPYRRAKTLGCDGECSDVRAGEGFHLVGLEFVRERIDQHVEVAVEDFRQA